MQTASQLAPYLKNESRAKLEAARMDLVWKAQAYKRQIHNLNTMIVVINEAIADIKIQLAAEDAGGT